MIASKERQKLSSPFRLVWKDFDLGMGPVLALHPPSPHWPEAYEKFASLFHETLPNLSIKLHHIGSTSLVGSDSQGIKSKPIVDVLGESDSLQAFDLAQKSFENLGFEWLGENGIAGRRFLKLKSWRGPETFFHIHVFEKNSPQIESHLLFRDYLKVHPHVALAYEEQKMRLQSLFHESRDRYTETKSSMIDDILAKARFWKNHEGTP